MPATRREFIAAAAAGAAGLACAAAGGTAGAPASLPSGAVVLFQGDSITDGERNKKVDRPNHPGALGSGYPQLVAAAALHARPEAELRFYNRGISGNRVPDLAERWEADTIALKPSVLSILIGVNDFWHTLTGGYTGTVEDYETGYLALLQATRKALPDTRLVVLEPFVLRVGHVDDRWFSAMDERRAAAARVADRVSATFLPLQAMFDRLTLRTPPAYWVPDGVHPSPAGNAAIARLWRETVGA